jgi:putative transposase
MSQIRKTVEGKLYYITITVVGWIDIFTRKEYVYALMKNINTARSIKDCNYMAMLL